MRARRYALCVSAMRRVRMIERPGNDFACKCCGTIKIGDYRSGITKCALHGFSQCVLEDLPVVAQIVLNSLSVLEGVLDSTRSALVMHKANSLLTAKAYVDGGDPYKDHVVLREGSLRKGMIDICDEVERLIRTLYELQRSSKATRLRVLELVMPENDEDDDD